MFSRWRIWIAGAAIAVAVVALLLIAPSFVHKDKLRDAVIAGVKAATGQTLLVHGNARLTLLPLPLLTLDDVELTPSTAPNSVHFRAADLRVGLPISALFSHAPHIRSAQLDQPVLELGRGTAVSSVSAALSTLKKAAIPLTIEDGTLIYPRTTGEPVQAEHISLYLSPSSNGAMSASGQWMFGDIPLHMEMNAAAGNVESPLRITLSDNRNNTLIFSGKLQDGQISGALEVKLEQPYLSLTAAPSVETPTAYPIHISAHAQYDGTTLRFTAATFDTPDSAGKGEATFLLTDVPQATISLTFSRLKLNGQKLMSIIQGGISPFLPDSMHLNFNMAADNLFVDTTEFSNVVLKGSVNHAQVQIDNFSTTLPGNGSLSLSGTVADTAKGPRFQGVAEAHGPSLKNLLVTLEPAAMALPDSSFGAFYLHSNVFLSSEQLRISEADMKLGDLQLAGGMVTYFEAIPRVEADIALKNTDLDYFRDNWRIEQKSQGTHRFLLHVNNRVDFTWLRQLVPVIDLRVALNGFRFLDRDGQNATFRLYARRNEMGIYSIDMHYPDGEMKGEMKLSVTQDIPNITATLAIPTFNTAYFSEDGGMFGAPWVNPKAPANARWSQSLFDLSWMTGVTGIFDLAIGKLIHHGEEYDNFQIRSELKDEQLKVSKLSFNRFDGRMDATGTLVGGRVPGLSASFTFYNADLAQLLHSFSQLDEPPGRISISGTLTTSGINILSWVRQAEAKLAIACRGVRPPHFNLQGIVDGVNAASSVPDVVKNVDLALPSGSTEFAVDGDLNLAQGTFQTPELTLRTGRGEGTLTGRVDLITWKMDLEAIFQLPMLKSDTVPTLTVDIAGAPDDFTLKLDTSSLEAYVAKRIVGQ